MANAPSIVPLQISPPLVDMSYGPYFSATTNLNGNIDGGGYSPFGGRNTAAPTWTQGGTWNTTSGPTGDTNSGIQLQLTCTPGSNCSVIPSTWGILGRWLSPPAGTLFAMTPVNAQCLRFEIFGLRLAAVPSGTQCGQDTGLVFLGGGPAAGPITDISHTAGQNVGFGIVYSVSAAQYTFAAKQLSGNTNPLSARVNIGNPVNGLTNPSYWDFRFFAATKSSPAAIQFFMDGALISLGAAQSSWAAGTTLPTPPAGLGMGFVPTVISQTPSTDTANPLMYMSGCRMRIGSVNACLLENQS